VVEVREVGVDPKTRVGHWSFKVQRRPAAEGHQERRQRRAANAPSNAPLHSQESCIVS